MSDQTPALTILPFTDERAVFFHDINKAWIEDMFVLEDVDRDVLENPEARIIVPGGDILFVEAAGQGIIGTGALRRSGDSAFELTKMGVIGSVRGLKAGEFLLQALIERALTLGSTKLYLLTSQKCEAAIHLYEKNGFVHDADIMADYGAGYARCNVAMRWQGR